MILPILFFYMLLYFYKKIGLIKKSKLLSILVSCVFCIILILLIKSTYQTSPYRNEILYTMLNFFILNLFIINNKDFYNESEGYVAICLMLLVIFSFFLDYHLSRYIGVAIILYGIAIIKTTELKILKMNIFFYFVVFVVYQYFFLRNFEII